MNAQNRRAFAKRLQALRGPRSFVEFSEETGVSPSLLQRYETGAGLPSIENALSIARKQNVSLDWMFFGEGQK